MDTMYAQFGAFGVVLVGGLAVIRWLLSQLTQAEQRTEFLTDKFLDALNTVVKENSTTMRMLEQKMTTEHQKILVEIERLQQLMKRESR